ncbi:tRNA (cytidine(34)-2'-O)-methyltransferase [Parvularcula sp. LCG005]|uniref:tRNA (cytidine(34)-2'-O)-methyltransferase n=1 Tax=Parvularcula sp. LCG005 TaxID=3078805 RepID=UPI00294236DF|nr:TrmH family RNA methyltransferase [Parvularcula sp. LCG005]WOI52518.1 TrmH family RNA methyltransferase [Parvularcula sp. LCG005]
MDRVNNLALGLVLFQPEIATNLGAAIRIAACFDARLHVIEPCGFPWKSKDIARVAMDYTDLAPPQRHPSWSAFNASPPGRLVLLTTKADQTIHDHVFQAGDLIVMGQESAGAPPHVHAAAAARVRIPLGPQARSLNMAVAAAIALSEARRQIGYTPSDTPRTIDSGPPSA